MAKKKKRSHPTKRKMSEGTAIAVVVLGLTVGGIIAYYLLRWLVEFFFPNLL